MAPASEISVSFGTHQRWWQQGARAMEPVDLRYLSVVAETGSLSNAAQSLGIKPSTISRRIARLENELGLTILERGPFGMRLTAAGQDVLARARFALDALDAVAQAGKSSGAGQTGRLRLGVRMPPIGQPLQPLLAAWRTQHPGVALTLHELNDNEILVGLADSTLDAALVTAHTVRRGANTIPICREPLVVALPQGHELSSSDFIRWDMLRDQTVLTQGWDGSHAAREFYASLLGGTVKFSSHPASKQSVMALVGAGFGITLAAQSQADVVFPGVVYKPVREDDAWVTVELAWMPQKEDATVGRFVAFMRDEARSRNLL